MFEIFKVTHTYIMVLRIMSFEKLFNPLLWSKC